MDYVIRDFEDNEIGRTRDGRSAWQLIETRWPDAVASGLDRHLVRG